MEKPIQDHIYVSRIMRKPTICICKTKHVQYTVDQLRGDLCFRYIDGTCTILLLSKSDFCSKHKTRRFYRTPHNLCFGAKIRNTPLRGYILHGHVILFMGDGGYKLVVHYMYLHDIIHHDARYGRIGETEFAVLRTPCLSPVAICLTH